MTEYTPFPECPFCGYNDTCWWDAQALQTDGDTDVFTCASCSKEYQVTIHTDTYFTTKEYIDKE